MRTVLALFLFLASFAARPQSYDEGWAAYEDGDFETALSIFRALAQQDNGSAQFTLGRMFDNGLGVPQDAAKALEWYRLAAANEDRVAQFLLGLKYIRGDGIERDPENAARWFARSARHGYASAQLNLGTLYATGEGVERAACSWTRSRRRASSAIS